MTPIILKEGATPRQVIKALMQICTDRPKLMDKPIIVYRPVCEAESDGEFFEIGAIETIGNGEEEQIMFEA